ncbi:MAG: NAD(P)/FAD-dependent oxidoreductase [Sphingobacteriales bacterium]|jgi:predicted Rossmann fold flavoprotein|nr:NAD(P)/FAD-dependent oxidoreductase [Sphingobacteriales bacterium]MBP9142633.1 NAD(P)/FAD-dependent oxidoreductase [Chitinophagales bacterium]MDA0199616.1 NAD(P)/FAD-dependent oxidoreductase [Bacteroidota bacterium]MBK6888785.1 NAD(P)/FAD-dependent oxidoreductase [Sphingobacteriales bacterium]MBK7528708.1 NAD(P)/FAD-dependent oxidoreductase [Sphingobacteriales bacterium]
MPLQIAIIGGGAAGFFAAITCAETNPNAQITIYEKSTRVLDKVRISGGGRCNVTHACFEPRELVKFYPRGHKELLSVFSRFQPADTIAWFEKKGVSLKTEPDGRMFPQTNTSATIVNCLFSTAQRLGVQVKMQSGLTGLQQQTINSDTTNNWELTFSNGQIVIANAVLIATGASSTIYKILQPLGLKIEPLVPSLFTFNIPDSFLHDLSGVTIQNAVLSININGKKHQTSGPLLVTHWGLSGPAVLKLSAWAAHELAAVNYKFSLDINWLAFYTYETVLADLDLLRRRPAISGKTIINSPQYQLPRRLWERICQTAQIGQNLRWADVSNHYLKQLSLVLTQTKLNVTQKSTNKDEFVTAGGIALPQINFKTMEANLLKNLFFAGEVLNIDALTGGFNFQAAWSGGYLAGLAMANLNI